MVQWLGLHAFTAEGSVPGGGQLRSHKPRGDAKNKNYNEQKHDKVEEGWNYVSIERRLNYQMSVLFVDVPS